MTLLGPSGCGKTTLLRIIAGFEAATSGTLLFEGENLNIIPIHKRNFPMVFQSYALFPHMTVEQNIAYGLKQKKVPASDIAARVDKIIDITGLGPNRSKHPHQMSGGQQQRVALARAMVLEPKVMLFDEPLSNLDANLRISMREEIRRIQQSLGITVVYVTHDQEEAMAVSDRIVVMNHGVVEQVGTPTELYLKPASAFVANFIGQADIVPINSAGQGTSFLSGTYSTALNQGMTHVVLRPDFAIIDINGKHEGRVIRKTYLGANWKLLVRVGEMECSLYTPPRTGADIKVEQLIRFSYQEDMLHFL